MAEEDTSRRKMLTVLVGAGSCALGVAIAGPAIVFATGPALGAAVTSGRWVKVAKLSSVPNGAPVKLPVVAEQHDAWSVAKDVELGAIWVRRDGDKVSAFSCVCPHLGCAVQAEPTGFFCPCHASRFDASGKKESGPSPRDLDALDTKVENGDLFVSFKRFRVGTAEREVTG